MSKLEVIKVTGSAIDSITTLLSGERAIHSGICPESIIVDMDEIDMSDENIMESGDPIEATLRHNLGEIMKEQGHTISELEIVGYYHFIKG